MGEMVTAPVCRDAVMVIPGIMGSELVDAETGDVLCPLCQTVVRHETYEFFEAKQGETGLLRQ